jgi:hypothetical protein
MRLPNPATYPRAESAIPSSTATGFASKATSSPTILTRQISTSPAARLIYDTPYLRMSRTRRRRDSTFRLSQIADRTTSRPIVVPVPRNGSRVFNESSFDLTMMAIASRYRSLLGMLWISRKPRSWILPIHARSESLTMTRRMR